MSNTSELNAEIRSQHGKGHARRLRDTGKIPAVIYGADKAPESITLVHKDLAHALEDEGFYSRIITLKIDGKPSKVILKDLHRHVYKPKILHADFFRINEKEKLTMSVALHFLGGDVAPGVKAGGQVSNLMNEVEIRCLPGNLPEAIEVDISGMELDQTLHLTDLKVPEGVEIVALTQGDVEEHNQGIVSIHVPRVQAEPEPTEEAAEGEGEGESAEKSEEAKPDGEQ